MGRRGPVGRCSCCAPGSEEARRDGGDGARRGAGAPSSRRGPRGRRLRGRAPAAVQDWREVAVEVWHGWGWPPDVSRVHLVRDERRRRRPDHAHGCRVVRAGHALAPDDPLAGRSRWDARTSTRWVERMRAGESIIGAIATFPEQERRALRHQNDRVPRVLPDHRGRRLVGLHRLRRLRRRSRLVGERPRRAADGRRAARRGDRAPRQEERLRDAEARYRSVVERIPAVTYVDVVEPDRRPAWRSSARRSRRCSAIRTNGSSPNPTSWFDLVHPDDQERVDGGAAGQAGQQRRPVRRGVPDASRRRSLGLGPRHDHARARRRGTDRRRTSRGS